MTLNTTLVLIILGMLAVVAYLWWHRDNANNAPLPPGPPSLPLVGNLFNMPSNNSTWVAFGTLAEKYGDVMHFKVMSQHIIIVSSLEAATELFEKRGIIYSDRFLSVTMGKLMEMGWAFSMISYNDEWRRKRKVFHQYLGSNVAQEYGAQEAEHVTEYLRRLRDTPEKFFDHSRFVFAAILMDVIYGLKIADANNKHVAAAEAWDEGFNQAIEPGRFWVDFLPFLQYIPEWFPGAHFKRLFAEWKRHMYKSRDGPFDEAKEAYTTGSAIPCAVTRVLEYVPEYEGSVEYDHETTARDSFGVSFGAGVDTSAPTMHFFFYLMLMYPEIQKQAQEELRKIVGPDRLPTLEDRERLPFTESIMKETLRLHPATPLALPHYTKTDDIYNGFFIPKNSVVIGNAWKILHDPALYPNPHAFNPKRYLNTDGTINPDVPDPTIACFGFGRRICPGRFISMDSMFLAMAGTLHTFDITPALGPDGKPLQVELRLAAGVICHPEHFPCNIKIRPGAEALLE
ncbi:hypothetical protein QCA50_007557 [Cerrena zonata]|uniref:Cytochrome P450 n=1 Tax=Cerrena zonata TaxID=2478898 RepID=A0AAW0G5D9_9APHY